MDRKQAKIHCSPPKYLGGEFRKAKLSPEEMRNEIMVIVRKTQLNSTRGASALVKTMRQRRLMYLLSQYPFDLHKFTMITKIQIKSITEDYLNKCFDSKRNFAKKAIGKMRGKEWNKICTKITVMVGEIQAYNGAGGREENIWREEQQELVRLLSKYPNALWYLDSETKEHIKLFVNVYLNTCYGTQKGGSCW